MPRTIKDVKEWLLGWKRLCDHISETTWGDEDDKMVTEILELLRQFKDLKEIIACGVPQLEEFIRDLEVHKK